MYSLSYGKSYTNAPSTTLSCAPLGPSVYRHQHPWVPRIDLSQCPIDPLPNAGGNAGGQTGGLVLPVNVGELLQGKGYTIYTFYCT